jgi:hypothetical protein
MSCGYATMKLTGKYKPYENVACKREQDLESEQNFEYGEIRTQIHILRTQFYECVLEFNYATIKGFA